MTQNRITANPYAPSFYPASELSFHPQLQESLLLVFDSLLIALENISSPMILVEP